LLQNGVHQDYT